MDATTERDIEALRLLTDAEERLEAALKAMPNSPGSVFRAANTRDLYRALRAVTAVRRLAAQELERRLR
jgi:hypothetical protein